MKFDVTIIETLTRTIQVDADDEIEAKDIVFEMIDNEEIVLTADDFNDREVFAMRKGDN